MNIKIIIKNPSFTVPDRMKTNGEVLLNLTEAESMSLYSNVFELNDVNEIKISGALGFSVKETELNRMLFWNAYNPNRTCAVDVTYDVEVIAECFVLDYKRLIYSSYDDQQREINLLLDFAEDHWLTGIKKVTTKDLDYGAKFLHGHVNIVDNWQNNYYYESGKKPYYFPIAVYGTTVARHYSDGGSAVHPHLYTISCLRPWLSMKWLLDKGFCKAGWTLKTALDDTDIYKRMWCYLLKSDFWKTDVKSDRGRWLRFEVESGSETSWLPRFDDKVSGTNHDVNGNFQAGVVLMPGEVDPFKSIGYWRNPLGHTIEMLFSTTVTIEVITGGGDMELEFITFSKYTSGGEPQYVDNQHFKVPINIPAGQTKTIDMEQLIAVNANEYVVINLIWNVKISNNIKFKAGAKFSGEMATGCYMTGDYIDMQVSVDEYTIEDLFVSFLQLINGKIITDNLTKTVFVYPELPTELADGTDVEGYYLNALEDITSIILQNSYKHTSNRDAVARYLDLKFKTSTDPYIKNLNQDKTLHGKVIDYGFKNDQTKTIENKLFEPTADKPLSTALRHINGIDFITVPFITDSEEPTLAYNIKPRIAISLGYEGQTVVDKNTGVPVIPGRVAKWQFEASDYLQDVTHPVQTRSECPTVTQKASYLIGTSGQRVNDMLAFGDGAFDLFYLFYFSYINYVRNERVNFLANVEPEMFFSDVFRKVKVFDYEGQTVRMRLTAINDFRVEENIATPVEMIPHTSTDKKFKCNCQYNKAIFYQPFISVSYPEPNNYEIVSVKIDGVEQLAAPVNLGAINNITFNMVTYTTNMVDAINSLGVEGLSAEYFVDMNENNFSERMKVEMLSCLFYEIIIKTVGGVNFLRYTNIGVNDWNSSLGQWKYKYDGTGDPHVRYEAYGQEKVNKLQQCL